MDLLFAHEKGDPFLDGDLDDETAAQQARKASKVEQHIKDQLDYGESARDLSRQGWAVVVPEGKDGDRLVELAKPLIDKRSEDLGRNKDALVIRVPPGLDERQASEWKRNDYAPQYKGTLENQPLYLCILGDIDQVSHATQQVLALDGVPGRIPFTVDEAEKYEAYVDKVVRWERSPTPHDKARSLFYTVHDGTAATRAGYGKLIKPCFDKCLQDWKNEDGRMNYPAHSVEDLGEEEPFPDEFLDLARSDHPAVVFTMSHGMGPPRGRKYTPEQARERQGAMHFGRNGAIMPSDIASQTFFPGGVWFYFACFGAGTPSESAYLHWMQQLRKNGMEDVGPVQTVLEGLSETGGFTSGTARAALANPNGPLAVLSHIDLAWSYSYDELQVRGSKITNTNRTENFRQMLATLIKRENRVGMVSLNLRTFLSTVVDGINSQYNHRQSIAESGAEVSSTEELALGNLWMFRQDLNGYILLGDPATRLPLSEPEKPSSGFFIPGMRRPASPARDTGARDTSARDTDADASSDVDPARLKKAEHAILEIAVEEATPKQAGRQLGVSSDTAREWHDIYREAGRQALARAMSKHVPEDDDD